MRIWIETPLTAGEQLAVMSLVKLDNTVALIEAESYDEEESYAVRVAEQLKQEELATITRDHQLMNLDVIPGTSVNCERLFSLTKNILTNTHKCTSPVLFEALLFLKVNSTLWDEYSVGKAMGQTRELKERERNEGNAYDDNSEYNRGGSNDEYGSHVEFLLMDPYV
jgi:hypothetical protein